MTGPTADVLELLPMWIGMTGETFGAEPEKSSIQILARVRQGGADKFGTMAIATTECPVPAFQHISRQIMIERFGSTVAPIDQFEVASVVFNMAGMALLVIWPRVKSLAGVDTFFQHGVTDQAEIFAHPLAFSMALEAAIVAFEISMGPAELARRDLGLGRGGRQ